MGNLFFKISLLFIITILSFSSCGKDDDTNNPNENTRGVLTAKIDGQMIDFNFANIGESEVIGVISNILGTKTFSVQGVDEINTGTAGAISILTIFFVMPVSESLIETSYNYNGADGCDSTMIEPCGTIIYHNLDGNTYGSTVENGTSAFTFSSLDFQAGGHAIGTFSGILKDDFSGEMVTISDGKFNVKILE